MARPAAEACKLSREASLKLLAPHPVRTCSQRIRILAAILAVATNARRMRYLYFAWHEDEGDIWVMDFARE